MKNKRFFESASGTVCLMLILTAVIFLSLIFGSSSMTFAELTGGFMKKDGFETASVILYSVRLPRIIGGLIAGVGLSVSGCLLQCVTGNRLASPNIIGVNSGAGLFMILLLNFFPSMVYLQPFAAFFGALIAAFVIMLVASRVDSGASSVILSGIAVTTLFNAGISFTSYFNSDLLSTYNYFSVGGLSGCEKNELVIPFIIVGISFAVALLISDKADVLSLGDSAAYTLGVNVKLLRTVCVILACASAASVVCFAGLLGFVGLVVPHIARKLSGERMSTQLTVSSLCGAILVIVADLLGRVVFAPSEVPVGIVMAFIGSPFLFGLLIRRKRYD